MLLWSREFTLWQPTFVDFQIVGMVINRVLVWGASGALLSILEGEPQWNIYRTAVNFKKNTKWQPFVAIKMIISASILILYYLQKHGSGQNSEIQALGIHSCRSQSDAGLKGNGANTDVTFTFF